MKSKELEERMAWLRKFCATRPRCCAEIARLFSLHNGKLPSSKKSTRIVDLVARVRFKKQKGFVLIHVEHQGRRQCRIEFRLFLYMAWLMEQYGWPVYTRSC